MRNFLGTFFLLLLLIFSCANRRSAPGITDDKIMIGNIQDLSGPMKELGALLPSGSNLYFQYVNEQGGIHDRKIEMKVEDHGYNPQKAMASAKKLIEKDQVFCLYNNKTQSDFPIILYFDTQVPKPTSGSWNQPSHANYLDCSANDHKGCAFTVIIKPKSTKSLYQQAEELKNPPTKNNSNP